jgi:acetoin utilization protein AcuB
MLVGQRMRQPVITILPDDSLAHAHRLMQTHHIRHLPVLRGDTLIGILSSRDIRKAAVPSGAAVEARAEAERLEATPVSAIMIRDVVAAAPFTPIEHCARLMTEHKIGCLPVVSAGRLEGIVTTTDVLATMAEMMGALEPGSRLEVEVASAPGELGRVVRCIEGGGERIASIATIPSGEGGRTTLVIRVPTINPGPLIQALQTAGYRVAARERRP